MRTILDVGPINEVYLPWLCRPVRPLRDLIALIRIYSQLCRHKPRIVHTHMAKAGTLGRLATLAYNEGNMAEAVKQAEIARSKTPNDLRVLRILAEAYGKLGDKAKAKEAQQAIAALDPKAGAGDLFNDGVREYNAGNCSAAVDLFERALAADSGNAKAHYMLGVCLASTDTAKAREHLQKFVEMAPSDPDAAAAKEMIQYLK